MFFSSLLTWCRYKFKVEITEVRSLASQSWGYVLRMRLLTRNT